mmetsp:Transcript_12259/g.17796  ORF Transcript_12259/g.17796 Transcript_12259/m.17796 type:complete len:310 (-) Transcript_12259:347-1276(-)
MMSALQKCLELFRHSGLDNRLRSKGRVPQLTSVVPLHLHPVLCKPQVVQQPRNMILEMFGIRVMKPARYHVQRLVHWTDTNPVRIDVLMLYQFDDFVQCRLSNPLLSRELKRVLVPVDGVPEKRLDLGTLKVFINRTTLAPASWPVNALIGFQVDLSSDLLDQIRDRSDSSRTVQIRLGEVHNSAMAPETSRMDRNPIRQDPVLRRDRVKGVIFMHPENTKPQFCPRGREQGSSVISNPFSGRRCIRIVPLQAEKTHGNVVHYRALHRALALDVEAETSVFVLVIPQIPCHLLPTMLAKIRAGNVASDY